MLFLRLDLHHTRDSSAHVTEMIKNEGSNKEKLVTVWEMSEWNTEVTFEMFKILLALGPPHIWFLRNCFFFRGKFWADKGP